MQLGICHSCPVLDVHMKDQRPFVVHSITAAGLSKPL